MEFKSAGDSRGPYRSWPRAVPAEGTGARGLIHQRLSGTTWGTLQGAGQASEPPQASPERCQAGTLHERENLWRIKDAELRGAKDGAPRDH